MTCYHPMKGWLSRASAAEGKRGITFSRKDAYIDKPLEVPCGRCVGCRLDRSRAWAVRCMHEASLHDVNCFVTLTYRPECLPDDGSLRLDDFQRFMKRLRKRTGPGVRFYACGEYGDQLARPHYHACLFNCDFGDKVLFKVSNGKRLYTSLALDEIWGLGHCTVGDVTFESAAYVARYVLKKAYGASSDAHYTDPVSGVVKAPEFTTMSRRPGIGSRWFEKYKSDVFPHDRVIKDGYPIKPPRFYDTALEKTDPEMFERVKEKRVSDALKRVDDNTPERLAVREQVKKAQLQRLKRNMEKGD